MSTQTQIDKYNLTSFNLIFCLSTGNINISLQISLNMYDLAISKSDLHKTIDKKKIEFHNKTYF